MNGSSGYRGATGTPTGKNPTGGFKEKVPEGYKQGRLQNFTPEMMELFQSLFSHLGPDSFLSKIAGGDQSSFEEMEAPAQRQFSGQLGNIASRFSGMGTGGRHSSGFQNTATAAASNFSQELQSRRQDLQRQAVNDLMGLSSNLLDQRPYENFLTKKEQPDEKGFNWGGLLGGLAGGAAGFFSPVPGGALAGASLGYGAGSSFSGYNGSDTAKLGLEASKYFY
jgi:hypothetical protein